MSYIIQDFNKWKGVNEQDIPEKAKQLGGGAKVVIEPIDKSSLKIKLVNEIDVIDNNGRLTNKGFAAILNNIKGQPSIINYYTALNDLSSNVVVYTVAKENDRKSVLVFKIYSKAGLKQNDPSAPGISASVQFVHQDNLKSAIAGKVLKGEGPQNQPQTQTTGLTFPIEANRIVNSSDAKLIQFFVDAYNKVKKDASIQADPIMAKVKAEVQSKKLGSATVTFLKGLNAGFSIKDAQFGEDLETSLTKTLFDKINALPADSTTLAGFDVEAFKKAVEGAGLDLGGIKVPTGGFTEGMQNNPELKKFQDLLISKFAKGLANHKTYQDFKKQAPMKGNYGPLTHNLVALLKTIARDPEFPNTDGSKIEPEFVNAVVTAKVNESYLGLDGKTVINETSFDFSAINTVDLSVQKPLVNRKNTPVEVAKNPFKTEAEVKAFQDWVIGTKKDTQILGKTGADSNWGPNTAKAWEKYGKDYKKGGTQSTKSRKLSDDAIKGHAHALLKAMDGPATDEDEIYGVYKQIKSPADLIALHKAFKKEPGAKGKTLTDWLYDELEDNNEWKKIFDIIENNQVIDKTAFLEIKVYSENGKTTKDYKEGYVKLYKNALAASK